METNGVYFGAEIVRDLTPAPGSLMEKRRWGERVGWGRAGRRSLLLWLPLSCFLSPTPVSVPLCPSVSLPSSSSGCQSQSLPPHPPATSHVCLFFSGQGSRTPSFGDPGSPRVVSRSRECWANWDQDLQGLGEVGAGVGRVPAHGR